MASTDAKPLPQKNVAYRVTFPILDADGDLVTGASGLDSEISKDGGTFADCTNEATEIATNSGMYYLDLTSTEMNADTVAIIVKTSSSGAKTTAIVLYPEEAGDVRVNVTQFGGSNLTAASGIPEVKVASIAADAISASAIAPDAIGASELAAGAASEIASAVRTELATELGRVDVAISTRLAGASYTAPLDAAGTRSAVGLASANLDTQLSGISNKTTNLPSDPADASDIASALGTVNSNVALVYDRLGAPAGASIAADIAAVSGGSGPTAEEIADAVHDEVVDGTLTLRQSIRLLNSSAFGKLSGAATATVVIRDAADTKDRITATVDADGNRSAVATDAS